MTEESPSTLVALLEKIDSLELQGAERALMWAILSAAESVLQVVEPKLDRSFADEFARAFTAGRTDSTSFAAAGPVQYKALMIIK
jgi:hypothetical protein